MVDFKSIETFLWVVTLGSFPRRGPEAQHHPTGHFATESRSSNARWAVKLLNRDPPRASRHQRRQLMFYAEKLIGLRSE